jgi:small subunit ribosomal protein S17e
LGKAVPRSIKIKVETLLEKFPERFGPDFERNKQILSDLNLSLSRFDRNMIAGFITRKMNEPKKS